MRSWDAVVIGGGIIGCTVAHTLAEAGRRVALIDQGSPPHGTSSATQSNLAMHHRVPGTELDLALKSHAMYFELQNQGNEEVAFCSPGGISLLTEHSQFEIAKKRVREQREGGLHTELLDSQAAKAADQYLSPNVVGAIYCPMSATFYAPGVCYALLRQARALGAEVFALTRATGIRRERDQVIAVETDSGLFPCEDVIVAAGVSSGTIAKSAGVSLQIYPNRGHIGVTAAVPQLGMRLKGEFPFGLEIPYEPSPVGKEQQRWEVRLVWTQMTNGHILLGRSNEIGRIDKRANFRAVQAILSRVVTWIPSAASLPIIRVFTGVRPQSADHLPIVGPALEVKGLWFAVGFGDKGFGLAYAARLLAKEIVSGTMDPLLSSYRYGRPSLSVA